ncbi:MAG: iron-sulfur cluster assembly scaffold protein [Parasphingorhabdus sp.]
MSEALYTKDILRLAVSIPHEERLVDSDGSAECRSKSCGSRVAADIVVSADGKIANLGVQVNACALGQASASILAREAIGKTKSQIEQARIQLLMYLSGKSKEIGRWDKMDLLEPVREHKGRHAAVLLPYDAVLAAFADAHSKMKVV